MFTPLCAPYLSTYCSMFTPIRARLSSTYCSIFTPYVPACPPCSEAWKHPALLPITVQPSQLIMAGRYNQLISSVCACMSDPLHSPDFLPATFTPRLVPLPHPSTLLPVIGFSQIFQILNNYSGWNIKHVCHDGYWKVCNFMLIISIHHKEKTL